MRHLALFSFLLIISCTSKEELPNIVYILADDLGYGDVSSFNPDSKIITTHIDKLASEGMTFTDAHSSSAVCTPTRYGLLTAEYSWRTRLKRGVLWSWDEPLIHDTTTTVGDVLQDQGYHTACIGKWHLGLGWQKDSMGEIDVTQPLDGDPTDLGFDYFFGITASLDIPPYFYIKNDRITANQIDTIDEMEGKAFWRKGLIGDDFVHEEVLPRLTEEALQYIEDRSKSEQPFFLYFPLPAPHTPILPIGEFYGKSNTNEYGDFVLMVDDVVGQIRTKLRQLDLSDETLIIFTSDNGASPMADFAELDSVGHHPSSHWRGHKADIYEGGHRVPFVASWPGVISPGSSSSTTICLNDLLPTCMQLRRETWQHRGKSHADGFSMLPLFLGNDEAYTREYVVHHSVDGYYAIRRDDWKLIFAYGSGGWSDPIEKEAKENNMPPRQLYNLISDPSETRNLVSIDSSKIKGLLDLADDDMLQLIDMSYGDSPWIIEEDIE